MRYEDLRTKHLADVDEALRELESERERLLALKRMYEGPFVPAQMEMSVSSSEPRTRIPKREGILLALKEAGDAGMHDYALGDRVRELGVALKRDVKRPKRSGLDFELHALMDEGLIERHKPATYRLLKPKAIYPVAEESTVSGRLNTILQAIR
jgi:hypothetical protein